MTCSTTYEKFGSICIFKIYVVILIVNASKENLKENDDEIFKF